MTNYVVLSTTDHGAAHWLARSGYNFAKGQQVSPVFLAELGKLLPQYALGFIKNEDGFQAVVLTGLGEERNVYLGADGLWLSQYVPAKLRGYPFALIDRGDGEKVLCIEETHLLENQEAEHLNSLPLFDEKSELTHEAAKLLNFLNFCEHNRVLTDTACLKLADAGLIEPWVIELIRGEEEVPTEVRGVYRINEELLNTLDAQVIGVLREGGALSLAYAQLFSMSQIEQLNLRDKYQDQQIKSAPQNETNGILEDSGNISFDFL
ncbi:MAG: hypothetical protein ACI9WR_000123 [Paracoccaceae bacterium]|jgi:hypothetical protein